MSDRHLAWPTYSMREGHQVLKSLRLEIQRTAEEIEGLFDDSLTVMVVTIVSANRDQGDPPITGMSCNYPFDGKPRCLYFVGDSDLAEKTARALIDLAYQNEASVKCRPAAVLMQRADVPDGSIVIEPPSRRTTIERHVARIYKQIKG
jgi:hypothetical protein